MNLYGPTETTLAKCFRSISVREPDPGVQSIVGARCRKTQVLILNRRRQRAGLENEIGEIIVIRTPFRTLGYLNDPEQTARVFVQNPFSSDPDDLVYLTGDSGRVQDGRAVLEILGRIDNQVKIRGVRIEPGEIETAIGQHASIREAVVVPRDDVMGTKILVAYVVLRASAESRPESDVIADLRAFLRARLPDAMVPSAFVVLSAIPLNPNGKVDKKALPLPERAEAEGNAAPSSAREQQLAAIWQEALGVPSVGVHESFFDLGGDSLTAIGVIIRMRSLGIDEAMCRAIFQGDTIAEIASSEAGESAARNGPPRRETQSRLLLNAIRGFLAILLVASHWLPWIVKHVFRGASSLSDAMAPPSAGVLPRASRSHSG